MEKIPVISEVYGIRLTVSESNFVIDYFNSVNIFDHLLKPWLNEMVRLQSYIKTELSYNYYYNPFLQQLMSDAMEFDMFVDLSIEHNRFIIYPMGKREYLFGWRVSESCNSSFFYSLFPIMGVSHLHAKEIIEVPHGEYPWERGVTKTDELFYTETGSDFILKRGAVSFSALDEIEAVLKPHPIYLDYLELKKKLWYKYCGNTFIPYRSYAHDDWYGTNNYFEPVDLLYKMLSKKIPSIIYSADRLRKFLYFYWE